MVSARARACWGARSPPRQCTQDWPVLALCDPHRRGAGPPREATGLDADRLAGSGPGSWVLHSLCPV